MAVTANSFGVRTGQREAGLLSVIKLCELPGFNSMAVVTFAPETRGMHILNGMAIIACHRQVLVNFTQMT